MRIVRTHKEFIMARSDLILKLNVRKDERTVTPVETGGHISYFFRTFVAKFKYASLTNLIFAGIFALPLLFSAFVLPNLMLNYVMAGKSFIGNFGIGFPNVADDVNAALADLMRWYRILIFPCNIGSILLAFVGLSGVFHVSRGLMWDEKVKVRSFFRGIKALWAPFLAAGAMTAAVAAGIMYGMGWHMGLYLTGAATAGSWIVFVLLLLVGLLWVMFLSMLLPTLACYRFRFGEACKNALLLNLITPITSVFVSAFGIGLLLLSFISAFISYLMLALMLVCGFMFLAMMFTTYGQYCFDNFIVPQVDPRDPTKRRDVVVKSRRGGADEVTERNPYAKTQQRGPQKYGQYRANNGKKKKKKKK